MTALYKRIKFQAAILILIFIISACQKENFVEPVDPYKVQRLEPNPQTFILGNSKNGMIIEANKSDITQTSSGVKIHGSLYAKSSKYGDVYISSGYFELVKGTSKSNNGTSSQIFTGFSGNALVKLPEEGILKNLTMSGITSVPIGYKKGSEFDTGNFGWPVNENRYYFYYNLETPFGANLTNTKFENLKKIAIDPTDPFFFVSGDISGTKLGDLSDVGFAMSAQGLIPFTPLVSTKEMPMSSFHGNIYIAGSIPLGEYPASFTGESVIAFGPNKSDDANKFFEGKASNFKMGLNGQVTFDNEKLDWMGIEVVLGQATLEFDMQKSGHTTLKFVGVRKDPPISVSDFLNDVIGKDWNFLDYLVPYKQKETFYGSIGTKLSDWEMGFKLESSLELPGNHHIDMGHSYLEVNSKSMHFSGEAVVAGFNRIGVLGYAQKNGHFKLTGYAKSGFSVSWHKLSLSFNMAISTSIGYDGVFRFTGNATLKGKASVWKLHANFTIRASFSIASDGSYKVRFSIGIGKHGFDVTISFKPKSSLTEPYTPIMRYREISLSMVPVQNRFPATENIK